MRIGIRPPALALALLTAVGIAATAALAASTSSMTLHASDLPKGFSQDFSHAIPRVQVRALQGRTLPGYIEGWQTELTRIHGVRSAAVTSSALRYGTRAQAHTAFMQIWKQIAKRSGARPFRVGVGHESRAFSYPSKLVTAYAIVWRYKSVDALVLAVGLSSEGVTEQMTRQLALKQQARMAAAT